ncbi:hypothetical protein GCM10009801_70300 [Streptomyces albiaxialis]|uniref:Bacterial transcriptional activator domain-containing protein n=1 Tax=Streptomyces albiaxialis TaxID=329523 RepID=A0ABN2WTW0_9ACTN
MSVVELALLSRVAWRGQEITAPRLRGLLALLAEEPRAGCGTGRLVEGLWPDAGRDALPERPNKALQILVSRARALLGAEAVVRTPNGYRLALAEDRVDSSALLLRAAACAERARAGDHAAALAEAEEGLALWDGPVDGGGRDGGDGCGDRDGDETDGPVGALRAARTPVRDALVRARALALAELGRYAEAAGPLAGVAAAHPRDEEVLAGLLRAEAATRGPSAALTRYEAYRRELREALGTEPGAGLRAVQRELLRDEPPVARHGVPHEPNPLLGRDADIAAVEELLRASRAVTVVGTGGLGKTRLAHAVSRRAGRRAVHFVPLAGVTADGDVAAEVASALGAGEGRGARPGALAGRAPGDPVAAVRSALGPGPALLVLDNCEHVVAGAAALVRALVSASASEELRVLATSRAPLGLTSEAVYALPGLGPGTTAELFVQRARAARPGVELPPDAVAEVCGHLDGLPLAVELAAARVRALSVPEIARRLADRFALLRGGPRDVPERHRTLHAVVEWSWNLLAEDARAALRTLSAFPGGFSGEAAAHMLGGDALPLLEQAADQSLLTVADGPSGSVRYRMLETVREFGAARRAEAGEDEEAVARFLAWAREFGLAHYDVLVGPDPLAAWERIRAEQDNLVLALRHARARTDGASLASVTAVLAALWSTDLDYPRLVALAADTGPPLSHYRPEPAYVEAARAAAVLCTASLFMDHGPRATRQLVTLRRLPPAPPDTPARATAKVLAAIPEMRPPGYEVLHALCADAHPLVAGIAECVATYIWTYEHAPGRALAAARRMVAALEPVDIPALRVMAHARMSELCLQRARGDDAYAHLQAAHALLPRLGEEHDYSGIHQGLALACLQRGDPDEAERWLRHAEGTAAAQTGAFYSPDPGARAEIALARGRTETGLRLWREAVERLRGGSLLDPWALGIQSAAVTAHAHAGRTDLVQPTIDALRLHLRALLSPGAATPLPVLGTVLHALGTAGLPSGDTAPVRMLALAEHLHPPREFHPTMSATRARRAARAADPDAYTTAHAEYALLTPDALHEAARALLPTPDAP